MRTNPVNKSYQLNNLGQERTIFSRSIVASRDLDVDEVIQEDMLAIKPGGGMIYSDRLSCWVHLVKTGLARRALRSLLRSVMKICVAIRSSKLLTH